MATHLAKNVAPGVVAKMVDTVCLWSYKRVNGLWFTFCRVKESCLIMGTKISVGRRPISQLLTRFTYRNEKQHDEMAGKKTKDTGSVYDDIDPAKRKMLKRSENPQCH